VRFANRNDTARTEISAFGALGCGLSIRMGGWRLLEAAQVRLSDGQLIQIQQIERCRGAARRGLQKGRAEILGALLVANVGKMLANEARMKMHLSKERFSNLLLICDFIERKPYHLDRRQDVIILKYELVGPN